MNPVTITEREIQSLLEKQAQKEPCNDVPSTLLFEPPKQAGILIPLLRYQEVWHILFIRRTKVEGDRHSGQVAFPGGGSEKEDEDSETTALRETDEEIGIAPKDVRILGRLRDFITISNFQVTPIIGVIPWPYKLTNSPAEVSRAFTIPLSWLANPKNREIRQRKIPGFKNPAPVIYFKIYDNELLWGASASFTVELLNVLQLNRNNE